MPSFKVILGGLFTLLVISTGVLAVHAYKLNHTISDTGKLVNHSRAVLDQIEKIASEYKTVQLESNAFFVRRDTGLERRYQLARKLMTDGIDSLKLLARTDSGQTNNVRLLDENLGRLVLFTDSIVNNPVTFSDKVGLLSGIEIANNYRNAIQNQLNGIKKFERKLLLETQEKNSQRQDNFNTVLLTMVAAVFTLIASTFIIVRHNVNKLLKAERRLTKANELFFHLFSDSPVAMVISQPHDGVVIDCNHQFTQLTNYSREQVIGQTTAQLGLKNTLLNADALSSPDAEFEIYPVNSNPLWVSGSMLQVHLKDRECNLTTLIDITTRKQAEKEIRVSLEKEIELNKLKSNFVTLASHEFRTPLTAVLSSTSLIENYLQDSNKEKITRHLARIKSAVSLLTNILDEFLSLSRIEEGRIAPKHETLDIDLLIRSVVKNIKGMAKARQVINSTHVGNTFARTDSAILTQVLTNLVTNAIKYSPEGAEITIMSEVGKNLVVRITDSGIGIPLKDQPHIFERFFRASNAGTAPGTGLGLHLTRQYLDLLNGNITFTSSPGRGSTFTILIPLESTRLSEKYQSEH